MRLTSRRKVANKQNNTTNENNATANNLIIEQ